MSTKTTTYLHLLAALALTACSDDIAGDGTNGAATDNNAPLAFSTSVAPTMRGTLSGKSAADALNNTFYVFGLKNEGNASLDGNLVFNNSKLTYTDNSAGTSASNSAGWDYVGITKTDNEANHILGPVVDEVTGGYSPGVTTPTTQTIRYWDNSASHYTFYAFADGAGDIENGRITVTKKFSTQKADRYSNGYVVDITADADPSKLYFSNREYIAHSVNSSTQASNVYNDKVNFTFHNALAKVRVGMYETIPGYSVTLDAFEVAEDNTNPSFGDMTTAKTDKFSANLTNNTLGSTGTLTVTYSGTIVDAEVMPSASESNQPAISFASNSTNTLLTLGDNLKGGTDLTNATDGTGATSAATALFDKADKAYTAVYPQGDNKNTLKLKVDYTIKSKVGETTPVKGATVEVPAEYLQWKPGFAYTYLFKIGDQTNGTIGALTGLHPITLDAVTVSDGAGSEEVISTTSEGKVNILTVGYNPTTRVATVGADDYNTGDEIYASVYDTKNVITASATNTKLYSVTTDDASNYPITAATVQEYLEAAATNTSLINQHVTAWAETARYVTTVPGNNGTSYSISALNWTAESGVYAVEYTYSGSDTKTDKKVYKIVKVNGSEGLANGTLTLDVTAFTNTGGTIHPTLVVDGKTIDNADVDYSLDYDGSAGQAVPTTVVVSNNKTANVYITVPAATKATSTGSAYHVTATYHGRTYTAAFTMAQ